MWNSQRTNSCLSKSFSEISDEEGEQEEEDEEEEEEDTRKVLRNMTMLHWISRSEAEKIFMRISKTLSLLD